jgi:hypothetical protein
MNTRKTVYNKLFQEETKLSTHEVELGLVDDFNKLTNSFFISGQKFETSIQKIETSIKEMQAQYVEHVKTLSTLDNEYQKIRKSALDLGVEVPTDIVNNYKKVLAISKNELDTKKRFNNF